MLIFWWIILRSWLFICWAVFFIGIGMFLSSLTESPVIGGDQHLRGFILFVIIAWQSLKLCADQRTQRRHHHHPVPVNGRRTDLSYYKNQIIAGIAEIAGLVLSIAVYFIKSSVFENFIHDILEHFVLTGVFYNFAQNYIFDIGGLLYYLSVIYSFYIFDRAGSSEKTMELGGL